MTDSLVPRLTAPPYIPITQQDVWGEVKNRWKDLYSPENACPISDYGPPGTPKYESCKKTFEETWDRIKDELPDYPAGGPYNPPVDLLSVEDICYVASHPEPEIFPDLSKDLGALAKALQESFKRRVAPLYCEPPSGDYPPTSGGCICLPYFVSVFYEERPVPGFGPWGEIQETQSPVWGPISSIDVINIPPSSENVDGGFSVGIWCQGSPITFSSGWACSPSRIRRVSAASSGGEARLTSVGSIRPFSIEECDLYFGKTPEGYPSLTGECSVPFPPLESPALPNSLPYAVPNSPPIFAFPVNGPVCPTEENVIEIRVVYEGGQGPQGLPGERGENGQPGESTMRRIVRVGSENFLGSADPIPHNDLIVYCPSDCVFVRVDWVNVQDYPKSQITRNFHTSPNSGELDEWQLGRVFVSLQGIEGWFSPYCQASKGQTLIKLPDSNGIPYRVSVTDVYGIGVSVYDLGYRYRDFRWTNPEDLPPFEYSDP